MPLADQHADRRVARRRQVREPAGRPPLARAVAVDHVGDVGRLAEQPVQDERRGPRIAAAVAPQVQHQAAGTAQQRERGLQVGRGDVHAVQAVEREHAHAVGTPRDLGTEPARSRTSRGSCGGQPGGSASGTSDPSATYSSAKWRENSCATASISRHSSSVTARSSSPNRASSAALSRSPRSASGNSRSIQVHSTATRLPAVMPSASHASRVRKVVVAVFGDAHAHAEALDAVIGAAEAAARRSCGRWGT